MPTEDPKYTKLMLELADNAGIVTRETVGKLLQDAREREERKTQPLADFMKELQNEPPKIDEQEIARDRAWREQLMEQRRRSREQFITTIAEARRRNAERETTRDQRATRRAETYIRSALYRRGEQERERMLRLAEPRTTLSVSLEYTFEHVWLIMECEINRNGNLERYALPISSRTFEQIISLLQRARDHVDHMFIYQVMYWAERYHVASANTIVYALRQIGLPPMGLAGEYQIESRPASRRWDDRDALRDPPELDRAPPPVAVVAATITQTVPIQTPGRSIIIKPKR